MIRESRKIKTIAAMLEVDASIVRRLVESGELEAHTIGKRGVRVFIDSVCEYQVRKTRAVTKGPIVAAEKRRRRAAQTASYRAAIADLKADGLLD